MNDEHLIYSSPEFTSDSDIVTYIIKCDARNITQNYLGSLKQLYIYRDSNKNKLQVQMKIHGSTRDLNWNPQLRRVKFRSNDPPSQYFKSIIFFKQDARRFGCGYEVELPGIDMKNLLYAYNDYIERNIETQNRVEAEGSEGNLYFLLPMYDPCVRENEDDNDMALGHVDARVPLRVPSSTEFRF